MVQAPGKPHAGAVVPSDVDAAMKGARRIGVARGPLLVVPLRWCESGWHPSSFVGHRGTCTPRYRRRWGSEVRTLVVVRFRGVSVLPSRKPILWLRMPAVSSRLLDPLLLRSANRSRNPAGIRSRNIGFSAGEDAYPFNLSPRESHLRLPPSSASCVQVPHGDKLEQSQPDSTPQGLTSNRPRAQPLSWPHLHRLGLTAPACGLPGAWTMAPPGLALRAKVSAAYWLPIPSHPKSNAQCANGTIYIVVGINGNFTGTIIRRAVSQPTAGGDAFRHGPNWSHRSAAAARLGREIPRKAPLGCNRAHRAPSSGRQAHRGL